MIIKQNSSSNQKPVEYTNDEVNVLMNTLTVVYIVSLIIAIINAMIGKTYLPTSLKWFVNLLVILIAAGGTVVCLLRPLIKLIVRHHISVAWRPLSVVDHCIASIEAELAQWYDQLSFFKALAVLTLIGICNGCILSLTVIFCTSKIPEVLASVMTLMGITSLFVLLISLWIACLIPSGSPDLKIVQESEN